MKKDRPESVHRIETVAPGSIAQEMGVEAGDMLISINGMSVEDVFDYRYYCQDEELDVLIRKGESGEEWLLEIEKESDEDLGLGFDSGLMSEYRSCRNNCIFCFISQMPKGMRKTLYFKDDDARLSFLQGNYITLTNMSEHDLDRIIRYHLEPINISFHTMDPELRCRMLKNKHAGEAFAKVRRLKEAGIEMNGQIVLCRGINDGAQLEYSLQQFEQYLPELKSVSVVPVGLTKYRDNLPKLEPFGAEDARGVLEQIHRWQAYYFERYGTHLVHASDEWYILAGQELPPEESYDGYLQLENGVGMLRLLTEEVKETLAKDKGDERERRVSVVTGTLAEPYIRKLAGAVREKYPNVQAEVIPVINHFFGELITVSGLLTGQDILEQLKGRDLGDELLLPENMLRSGERVLLDDVTVEDLEVSLQIKVRIVESDGQSLVRALTGGET